MQENPQTIEFCEKLGITNPFKPRGKSRLCSILKNLPYMLLFCLFVCLLVIVRPTFPSLTRTPQTPQTPQSPQTPVTNPDEIELSEDSSPDKTPTREPGHDLVHTQQTHLTQDIAMYFSVAVSGSLLASLSSLCS